MQSKPQKLFLVASLLGIFMLLVLSLTLNPKEISACSINKTQDNEKVSIKGIVIDERVLSENFKLLILKNNGCEVDITCNCLQSFINNNVSIAGKVQTYNNKKQISAEMIEND
jgi:hypothetical protein